MSSKKVSFQYDDGVPENGLFMFIEDKEENKTDVVNFDLYMCNQLKTLLTKLLTEANENILKDAGFDEKLSFKAEKGKAFVNLDNLVGEPGEGSKAVANASQDD